MSDKSSVKKFAGIEIVSGLTRSNYFFLYLNTLFSGMLMVMVALIQPAFLKDVIRVSPDFFGQANGFLQNMSQVATLAFVAMIGIMSDKIGRKILAVTGFLVMACFYYLFGLSNQIAAAFNIPPGLSAQICALLSFAPSRAAEFTGFAPGLLTAYLLRLCLGIGMILCYPQFMTMAADYTSEKDRGKGMAMNGVMMGLASIIVFAALAPLGESLGVEGLFMIAGILSLVGFLFTLVFLKDRLPASKEEDSRGLREIFPIVMKSPTLKAGYLCALCTRADITVIATFLISWAVQSGDALRLTSEEASKRGAMPMIAMSIATLIAFPIVGVLLDRWGRLPTIITTLAASAVGLTLVALCPTPFSGFVFAAVALVGIGFSGSVAGANTLATEASPKSMVGSIMGGLNTMQPIGMLFFLQFGGWLYDVLGPGWAFGIKGAANLLMVIWLIANKNNIEHEMQAAQAPAA